MNIDLYFEKYKKTAEYLMNEADKYTENEFLTSLGEGQWSLGQMYHHIALVTDKCLTNIDGCGQGLGKQKAFALGPAIFSTMGSFPPIKMHIKKIPDSVSHLYHPEPKDIHQAITDLQQSIEKMKQYIPIVSAIEKNQRIEHWAGGWFTAAQWYQSAEMHIRHHLRQKKRIDAYLKKI